MFDFVRKKDVWEACDRGYFDELKSKNLSFQLKHAQDLAIYRLIRDMHDLEIAEIGGGNSRVLERIAMSNRCVNIEKFEGKHLGPNTVINFDRVLNINAYIGEFDSKLVDESFDTLFSISVVEHVETEKLDDFFRDSIRILKPGGVFFHAIDTYIQDEPTPYSIDRILRYKRWVTDYDFVSPIGDVFNGPLRFSTDMCTNPDNILYGWNKSVPSLSAVRVMSQSVSLLVAGRKNV